jgi:predicted N-acetyltransferase YhbS
VRRDDDGNGGPGRIIRQPHASVRGTTHPVEYLVRPARITDVDRLGALCAEAGSSVSGKTPLNSTDLLRQLVYLPHASVLVAEAQREVIGGAILALRPSVRAGGFVGTVDLLVVDSRHDADRVTDALIGELLRSARNKGCAIVEAVLPSEPAARARWERHGFTESSPLIERPVTAGEVSATR